MRQKIVLKDRMNVYRLVSRNNSEINMKTCFLTGGKIIGNNVILEGNGITENEKQILNDIT